MTDINSIKNQAKKAYKFDIGRNAGVEFIAFMVKFALIFTLITLYIICLANFGSFAASFPAAILLAAAFILVYLFVVAPVNFGRNLYFTKVADGVQPKTDELFHFYRNIKPALYAYFRIAIAMIFYTVLFTAITILYFRIYGLFSSNYFSILNFIVCTAIVVFYAYSIIVTRLKYSALPVVYDKNPPSSAIVLVAKTLRSAFGVKTNLFMLYLSFAGWFILGILSLGIGFIWIMPYIRIASKIYLINSVK